jgi:hypothetical protein
MAQLSMKQIRELALRNGVKLNNTKKGDAIRMIQRAEGNFDCFDSATAGVCDQWNCMWRNDCLK